MGNAKSAARASDGRRASVRRIATYLRARDACVVDGASRVEAYREDDAMGTAMTTVRRDACAKKGKVSRRDVGAVRVTRARDGDMDDDERAREGGAQAPAEATMGRRGTTRARWTVPRDAVVGREGDEDDDDDDDDDDDGRVRTVVSPAFSTDGCGFARAVWRLVWRVDDDSASLFLRLERSSRDADVVAAWTFALVGPERDERHHEVFVSAQRFAVGDTRGVVNYIAGVSEAESSRVEGECVVEAMFEPLDDDVFASNLKMFERLTIAHQSPLVRLISESPLLFVFEDFITDEEADHLMELAKPDLRRSRVTDGKLSEGRTSSGTFLTGARAHDAVVTRIGQRIQNALRDTPQIRQRQSQRLAAVEPMQVVSYQTGECYTAHFDNRANCLRRAVTFMCYLHEPRRGGATHFPKAKALANITGHCGTGVRILPKRRRAIAFWSVNGGVEDGASLHEAETVIEGNKQIFTQWLCLDDST